MLHTTILHLYMLYMSFQFLLLHLSLLHLSTLFPYTTLFRSPVCPQCPVGRRRNPAVIRERRCAMLRVERSEEHTSELQSPCNIVCRLLLEKKKKTIFKLIINIINFSVVEICDATKRINAEHN